jgi:hypothetical protein
VLIHQLGKDVEVVVVDKGVPLPAQGRQSPLHQGFDLLDLLSVLDIERMFPPIKKKK